MEHEQSMMRSSGRGLLSGPEDAVIETKLLFLHQESRLNISDMFSFFLKDNYYGWIAAFFKVPYIINFILGEEIIAKLYYY